MKHFLSIVLATSTMALFAGEPQLLKKSDNELPKERISLARKMQANSEGQANIVVKMNISQLTMKTLAFQGEYGFHKNLSFALGVHFVLPRKLPGFFGEEDPTGEGLRNTSFRGWAVTPELRFYPGRKEEHQAPHGFYLAPYFRYAKYTFTSGYHDFYGSKDYGYDLNLTYSGYTAGLMLGSQWIIGKHFSLDWWILGAGSGRAKLKMEVVGQGFILTPDERAELKSTLEQEFSGVSVFGKDAVVETTQNSASVTLGGLPMLSYRGFGLCLGYAF